MLSNGSFRISFRFRNQYPCADDYLIDLLKNQFDYEDVNQNNLVFDPNTGHQLSIVLLEHEDHRISIQNRRGIIGIETDKPETGKKVIQFIYDLFEKDKKIGIDISKDIRFVEIIYDMKWLSEISWHIVTRNTKQYDNELFNDFFGDRTQNYQIRISSRIPDDRLNDNVLNIDDFFEISIVPMSANPRRVHINYIYRNFDYERVIKTASKLDEKIRELIMELEGKNGK